VRYLYSRYPWYSSVRKTLEDPAYSDWYIDFKPVGPWKSSKCDAVNKTDCKYVTLTLGADFPLFLH
jgi:hypothetical protein